MNATALGNGPFNGYFTSAATLFELDPPMLLEGHDLPYLVLSSMPETSTQVALTAAFATDGEGNLDPVFYLQHGLVFERYGAQDIPGALAALGYDMVALPAPVPAASI